MMSGTVAVTLPEELTKLVDPSGVKVEARVREALVLFLFEHGTISSRKGAVLLGISWDGFLELLRERKIPYFQQTIEEVLEDAEVSASVRPDDGR